VDIGFSLYNPNRLNAVMPFSTLKIIGGDIQVQLRDTLAWEKAVDGMALEPGSRVRTGADGLASLSFSQGTMATLAPGTDVIIARLENNAENNPDTIALRQQSGKTWNQVTRLEDDRYYFQIETPSAQVMVHGTLFATEVDDSGKTTVRTTEGSVSVSAQGEEVEVPAGQQTTVEPGNAPAAPEPMPTPDSEILLTIDKPKAGLITDPTGSSTGYLADGTAINQIPGSQLSAPEAPMQSVRIPDPYAGEYSLMLHGVTGSAAVSIEAFAGGKPTMSYTDNVSTENNLMLKLHLDVLNGLLGRAQDSNPVPTVTTGTTKPTTAEPATVTPEAMPDTKESWFRSDGSIDSKWVVIGSIAALLIGILLIVWKKM
jgi:uncharacterized protein (DUF736 family)